jgi:hypothetical protein
MNPSRLGLRAHGTAEVKDAARTAKERTSRCVTESPAARTPRSAVLCGALIAVLTLIFAPPAQAAFGIANFEARATTEGGGPATQAGSHPFALELKLALNAEGPLGEGDLRDLSLALPPGLLANSSALDQCSEVQFNTPRSSPNEASLSGESCPDSSQIGVATVRSSLSGGTTRSFGVYNLVPRFGAPSAIGLAPFGTQIEFDGEIREADSAFTFALHSLSQATSLTSLDLTLWGTPWEHSHDELRGNCLNEANPAAPWGKCSTGSGLAPSPQAYLTLPSSCGQPLRFTARADSWQAPATVVEASASNLDAEGHPVGMSGCVEPLSVAKVQMQTESAASATGLVFNIDINDGGGFLHPLGIVRSPISKAVVILPEGLTINPSLGAGLVSCGAAQFAAETISTPPGSGCPNGSKIGDISVEGLLGLPEPVKGSLFLATPYENPSGSLLGLYFVVSDPRHGLFEKAVGRVEPDPHTGRLTATFEGLPQLHYTHFALGFREGQRAVMISPPACGAYVTALDLTPYSDPTTTLHESSTFNVSSGEGGGPCPGGGARPFHPALLAGSVNSQAGAYTPFDLEMTRTDAEQEITSYSATLPPGLLGKIAGVPYCSDAAIAAARGQSGTEALANPTCPAATRIGRTVSGYGVGQVLAYAPGALYLAGPYHGAPFSIVAIDSALVGPFDLGTVIVRSAIRVDPLSAQVSVDSSGSDPIPHILKGIPLHLRDIQVYVDRPGFMVNPTSCNPTQATSTLTGSGLDPFSSADDQPATSSQRYQVSNCSGLGFRPQLSLALRGGSGRGSYPSLRATFTPGPGDANLSSAAVTLPPAEFLAQQNIVSVCTRPQFAHGACPPRSQIGHAVAVTPLLSAPLEGPVYMRSSSNELPDLVADLQGDGIQVEVDGRIDSSHGGIRGRFEGLPDAPLTRFTMTLVGGRKRGILVNERDVCAAPQLALVRFVSQADVGRVLHPRLTASCGKTGKPRRHKGKHSKSKPKKKVTS